MRKVIFLILAVLLATLLCGCNILKGQLEPLNPKQEEVQMQKSESGEDTITYHDTLYGFDFTLPASWKGYQIIADIWEGVPPGSSNVVEKGPVITIRHELWTKEKPRQDIPILIFTLDQWKKLQKEKFHIGAAPIGPSELGRNNEYVFALPARYNYAFPEGYEEVEKILAGKPLHPKDIS